MSSEEARQFTSVCLVFANVGIIYCLAQTLHAYPLFDWDFANLEWVRTWLLFSILDNYGLVLSLSSLIMHSEEYIGLGLLWCAGICLPCLGSSFACAYLIYRLMHGSISLDGAITQRYFI